ncbi:riboflavin synthase subunit alpha [Tardibacter chloracetimidivorans]|uniref:Riboflavin synthase n=1 Tax=Tardibacter chloracetimidivorans TaxID=1921510 RepID=A0A1L3ZYI2_9SPHN|nr:riboflavin synthase [Tardibacter chloracetimidivorans]API60687.1 riboflavin synthase subunit alpha [Tardibacter chloracetimidivorans]
MFTGIITDVGTIDAIEQRGDLRVRVRAAYDMAGVDLGASIACSGVCLTVVDKDEGWFAVDVSTETVRRTAQGQWTVGRRLNLERALKVGDELGGHIVTGHVDGVGRIAAVAPEGDSQRVEIEAGAELAPFLAPKGSIAVDGVSLTMNTVDDLPGGGVRFGINVIPHTAQVTSFETLEPGREVNLEIDVIARYLGRMQSLRNSK